EGMAPPRRILFPPEEICVDWQQRRSAGAGLNNLGNTCFLKSVLQCLTRTPALANDLLSREHSRSCGRQGFCVMCVTEAHVNEVLRSSAGAVQPGAVISVLTREQFRLGTQEDAPEFLRHAVDAMQRACLSGSSDLDVSSPATTIVHQVFGGFPRSRGTFPRPCEAVSDSDEAFLDVPLDIKVRGVIAVLQTPQGPSSSVSAALQDFARPEQPDGENCFKCSKCDKMAAASKRFTVHRAPKDLRACPERFGGCTGTKIAKM
ncbi:UBP42 hydrolase, partial [Sagittarius serpentarius]|nr:UBP42 hydrolase [Sagittarius serpentarius]